MVHQLSSSFKAHGMVVTDLDGTLLSSDRSTSPTNFATLQELARHKIIRVIATGRSLYSVRKVIPRQFPIDYLVFSSGAGVINWHTQRILVTHHLSGEEIHLVSQQLFQHELDFMIHRPIPENHHFWYHTTGKENPDFVRRCKLYQAFASPLDGSVLPLEKACQFLIIDSEEDSLAKYHTLQKQLRTVKVIRTTSPLDGRSFWIEVFPKSVSKALASGWLARQHQIEHSNIFALGNDYNDLDLLQWAAESFVVANAPQEMKETYHPVASNDHDGFSEAVNVWMNC